MILPSLSESTVSAWLEISELLLLGCGALLLFGILGEYKKVPTRMAGWPHTIFETIVIVAIAGELLSDGGVSYFSRRLQKLEGSDIRTLSEKSQIALGKAVAAEGSAEFAATDSAKANDEAHAAERSAGAAQTLAKSARKEADSFETDIVSAKEQAAKAESDLADADKQAADAKLELQRIQANRSLTNLTDLAATLVAFRGTQYSFAGVYSNQESIALLQVIDDALQKAGWKRAKPPGGFPAINVFGTDKPYAVPASLISGIQIVVQSQQPVSTLRALPEDQLPPPVKAAAYLYHALSNSLSPPNANNIRKILVQKGDSQIIAIDVGQKP